MGYGRAGCSRCARTVTYGHGYFFQQGKGREARCLGCALRYGPMIRRALAVAGVVGTILTMINQGDLLLAGQITKAGLVKIPLTYALPFCVSVYSVLVVSRERTTASTTDARKSPT